jgi:hypothetical protein
MLLICTLMSLHNKVYRWNLLNHVLNEEKMTDFLIYIKKKKIFLSYSLFLFFIHFPSFFQSSQLFFLIHGQLRMLWPLAEPNASRHNVQTCSRSSFLLGGWSPSLVLEFWLSFDWLSSCCLCLVHSPSGLCVRCHFPRLHSSPLL